MKLYSHIVQRYKAVRNFVAEACTSSNCANSTTNADADVQDNISVGVSDDERKKRPRTAFTAAQIKSLEAEFERNKYLSVTKRMQLSKALKLTETQVNSLVIYKLSFCHYMHAYFEKLKNTEYNCVYKFHLYSFDLILCSI